MKKKINPVKNLHTSKLAIVVFSLFGLAFNLPFGAYAATFVDADFSQGWVSSIVVTDDEDIAGVGPGTSSGSVTRFGTGGNSGAYNQHSHNIDNGDRIYTVEINTNAIYSPSVSGAISTLDLTIDLIQNIVGPRSGSTGIYLALQQDNRIFISRFAIINNFDWDETQLIGLSAGDFDTRPQSSSQPDFSDNGLPILFGYALSNTVDGIGDLDVVHGVDNWVLTVNQASLSLIPEPSSGFMLSAGFLLFGFKRRIRQI